MRPPTTKQLHNSSASVNIINRSGNPELGQIAATRLAWEGFEVLNVSTSMDAKQVSSIIDYTGQIKGSALVSLREALNISQDSITIEPDPGRQYDYEVTLGYTYYPCTYDVLTPYVNP